MVGLGAGMEINSKVRFGKMPKPARWKRALRGYYVFVRLMLAFGSLGWGNIFHQGQCSENLSHRAVLRIVRGQRLIEFLTRLFRPHNLLDVE